MPSLNEMGNAGDVRSPRRRRQAAGIHFRREAQPPSCKFRSLYSVSCANGLVFSVEVCKVRNNSPRTPLILPSGFAGLAGQGERENYAQSCGEGGRSERQGLRMPECLAGAVRSADSVQVCPYGPTCGGRLLSGFRRTVVSKEGISRCFVGNTEVRAAKEKRKTSSQRSGARDLSSDGRADGHK